MANTEKMYSAKTERMGGDSSSVNTEPFLRSPITFSDNGETFEISTDIIGIGGESQVYYATAQSSGETCAAKISALSYTGANRANRKVVIEFLRTHTDYKKYHFMPLLGSGTIQIEADDGMPLPYTVDIFPFCSNGDLSKSNKRYTYAELKNRIIPALANALKAIHDANLIHRDIKPANIFEYDNEMIIGDFGTTVFTDDNNGESVTELARRTLGYSAPEINSRYAKKASDYFSLGCTIATLYNGIHPYETVLSSESDHAFYALIDEKGLDFTCVKGEESIKTLVNALTRNSWSERIGYDEIMLWLKDSNGFVQKYDKKEKNKSEGWQTPFKFEDTDYWNEQDLALAMFHNWEAAKRYLYRGQIKNFFDLIHDQTMSVRADTIVNERPTATNHDLGLSYFLHYLLKGGNLYWYGKEYSSLKEIASYINSREESSEEIDLNIIKMLQEGYISWKYNERLKSSDIKSDEKSAVEKDLSGIKTIEEYAKNFPNFAYYYAMFSWDKSVKFDIPNGDDLFGSITGSPEAFYNDGIDTVYNDYILAWLTSIGFMQALELKKSETQNKVSNIENLYSMFETICSDKQAVRNHYIKNSPNSYLYWLQNNLHLYTFNSNDANTLKVKIEQVKRTSQNTLAEIRDGFRELDGYFNEQGEFQKLFQGDYVIACLGLTKGVDRQGEITATSADAFFIDDFLGKTVPLGFKKYIGLK
jgi:serine/threonine protein kinase